MKECQCRIDPNIGFELATIVNCIISNHCCDSHCYHRHCFRLVSVTLVSHTGYRYQQRSEAIKPLVDSIHQTNRQTLLKLLKSERLCLDILNRFVIQMRCKRNGDRKPMNHRPNQFTSGLHYYYF